MRPIPITKILSVFLLEISCHSVFSETIQISDSALEQAIRNELSLPTGDISDTDMVNLRTLSADDLSISDLTGLEYATNLKELSLQDNNIVNLSPIFELVQLEDVDLRYNSIVDIQPIKELTKLEKLNLSETLVEDLSAISDLPSLKTLYLQGTKIADKDLEIISNIKSLTALFVSSPNISDYGLVAKSTGLLRLNIAESTLDDTTLDYIATNLPDLNYVYLNRNQITSLAPLSKLTKLRYISFSGNNITDLSPLSALDELSHITGEDNRISDLTPLISRSLLQQIELKNNQVTDISQLANLPHLHTLNIDQNNIANISPLVPLAMNDRLQSLDVSYNSLDIENDLQQKADLETLNIYTSFFLGYPQNPQEATFEDANLELAFREALQIPSEKILIEDLLELKALDASDRGISNLQGLTNAPNLTEIDLSKNEITTLDHFTYLRSIANIDLSENQLYLYANGPLHEQLEFLEQIGMVIATDTQTDPGFDSWLSLFYSDKDIELMKPSPEAADSDHDGANNRLEWLTRANPTDRTDRFEFRSTTEGNLLKIVFPTPPHEDVVLSVEASKDLLKWDPLSSEEVKSSEGEILHSIPLNSDFQAFRIQASRSHAQ